MAALTPPPVGVRRRPRGLRPSRTVAMPAGPEYPRRAALDRRARAPREPRSPRRPVPSIYSIGPPNDASVFRNGHQIDLVDFAIDHEHLAHTRMRRSSAKLSGISRPKPLFGQQSPGFIEHEDDGSLIVRFHAAGWLEMAWFLYQWGDAVEGLAPQKLRDMTAGYRRSEFEALP